MSKLDCSKKNQPWCYLDKHILNDAPTVWGPIAWDWLHKLAINYSDKPAKKDMTDIIFMFWNFIYGIPCITCRAHAYAYTQKVPPVFHNSIVFQNWVMKFHNTVNIRLGKPVVSMDEYERIYALELMKKIGT
jgi:hypothetical protein